MAVFTSCLGSKDSTSDYIYSPDAEIYSFSLTCSKVTELGQLLFTIDQLSGEIYNKDSLAFGIDVDSLISVVMNFTTAGTYVCYHPSVKEDSAQVATGATLDSLTFINNPQKYLRVYAEDGSIKEYTLTLRMHTVDPDSIVYTELEDSNLKEAKTDQVVLWFKNAFRNFVNNGTSINYYAAAEAETLTWTQGASSGIPAGLIVKDIKVFGTRLVGNTTDGKLYESSDCITWTEITAVNGITVGDVKTIFGELPGKGISLMTGTTGNYSFVFTDLETTWKVSPADLPSDFPVSGFSTIPLINDKASQLYIAGGIGQDNVAVYNTWILSNSLTDWDLLSGNAPLVSGGNTFFFEQQFLLLNGMVANDLNETAYVSKNKGIYWEEAPNKYKLPASAYPKRKNASLCVTPDGYIYIFGGASISNQALTDVWRGIINKSGFVD